MGSEIARHDDEAAAWAKVMAAKAAWEGLAQAWGAVSEAYVAMEAVAAARAKARQWVDENAKVLKLVMQMLVSTRPKAEAAKEVK